MVAKNNPNNSYSSPGTAANAATPGATPINMTNFPTRAHWFDSVWPLTEGERLLVTVQHDSDLSDIEEKVKDNPDHTFLLLVEDFDLLGRALPALWLRMPPEGGIPKNVWVGAAIKTQKEANERMKRLVKIRARRLFIMLKKGHDQNIDLHAGLIAWRCSNCGRKEGYNRMRRPEKCPSGLICSDATIEPQIHWVVSMDIHSAASLPLLCAKMGAAFWDNHSLQVPE